MFIPNIMASPLVGTGSSQSQQEGWVDFVNKFNNRHMNNADRVALMFREMRGDTVTYIDDNGVGFECSFNNLNQGRQFIEWFGETYNAFRNGETEEIKLEFHIDQKRDFSTRDANDAGDYDHGGNCTIRLVEEITEVFEWAAPIFVNSYNGSIAPRVLRSASTYNFLYGSAYETRSCGCSWCEKVVEKESEEGGEEITFERLQLPILKRNRISDDNIAGDAYNKTTCYKYLLCTQLMILLMDQTERDNGSSQSNVVLTLENYNGRLTLVRRSASAGGRRGRVLERREPRTLRDEGIILVRLPRRPDRRI